MTVRAFIVLLLVTVVAIWFGDSIAQEYAAPGLERTVAVLMVAALIVAPAAWLLGKVGWISAGRVELGRRRAQQAQQAQQAQEQQRQRNGGAA